MTSLRDELTRWGFSDTEVDVYLAALEAGRAPASEIADEADVSTRHVYRVSERLEEVGLVDVQDQYQPTRILPAPSEEVADIMRDRQEAIVSEIDRRRGDSDAHVGGVEVLKHMPTLLGRCRSMLAEAEEWAFLSAPPDLVERLEAELRAARDRGVVVLVFTEDVSEPPGQPLEEVASVVRVREDFDLFHQFALTVDAFRSLIGAPDATDLRADERCTPALYLEGRYVAPRISASFVEYEWKLGEERFVTEPASLPATFERLTGAVVHAALHRREGTDVHARIVGHPIDEDGSIRDTTATIEGTVVEVRQGIVEPSRKSFLFEQTITLDTGEERVTFGGRGATFEDYSARHVTLERADDAPT